MFLNNRYHDPTLGTFISVDPLVASTGEAYIYASGNPTTLSDPTGLEPGCSKDATAKQVRTCAASHMDAKYLANTGEQRNVTGQSWWESRTPDEQLPSWTQYGDGCLGNNPGKAGAAFCGVIFAAVIAAPAAPAAVASVTGTCLRFAFWCTRLAGLPGGGAGLVNDAYGGPGASPTVWSSTDDLVGPAANALERALPGRVVGVNQNVGMTTRSGFREIDVLLDGVYVQVKGKTGDGIAAQVLKTVETTGVPTVGFAPGMPNMAWEQAARNGVPIARSLEELVAIVQEMAG